MVRADQDLAPGGSVPSRALQVALDGRGVLLDSGYFVANLASTLAVNRGDDAEIRGRAVGTWVDSSLSSAADPRARAIGAVALALLRGTWRDADEGTTAHREYLEVLNGTRGTGRFATEPFEACWAECAAFARIGDEHAPLQVAMSYLRLYWREDREIVRSLFAVNAAGRPDPATLDRLAAWERCWFGSRNEEAPQVLLLQEPLHAFECGTTPIPTREQVLRRVRDACARDADRSPAPTGVIHAALRLCAAGLEAAERVADSWPEAERWRRKYEDVSIAIYISITSAGAIGIMMPLQVMTKGNVIVVEPCHALWLCLGECCADLDHAYAARGRG